MGGKYKRRTNHYIPLDGVIAELEWATREWQPSSWETEDKRQKVWGHFYGDSKWKRLDIRWALGHAALSSVERKVGRIMNKTPVADVAEMGGLEIQLRKATREDLAEFVIPSWLQSYSRSLVAKLMRADGRYSTGRDWYWSSQRKRIEDILSTSGVSVTVAYIEDTNIGWTVEDRSKRVLHYVYVRDAFRKQGVAGHLVGWINDSTGGVVRLTHLPPPWYSRPQETASGIKHLWAPHVIIDLISGN